MKTGRYAGGTIGRLGGYIHSLNLVLGKADAIEGESVRIFENSRLISVDTGPQSRPDQSRIGQGKLCFSLRQCLNWQSSV